VTDQVLYRYEAKRYSVVIDADADRYGVSAPELQLLRFAVTKVTKCGFWIDGWGERRWVSNSSRKRYAHPTAEEAMAAYVERKKAYVRHCRARLARAMGDLALAKPIGSTAGRLYADD
jgi:hypothetical protein